MNGIALSPAALWSLAKESAAAWMDDFAPSMGAAIAYYTAFSIAPLLIIVIAIAGLFFGREAASGYLYAQLDGLLGDQGARAIQGMVESASSTDEGVIATAVGVVLLAVGATTVFAELQTDLDRIWKRLGGGQGISTATVAGDQRDLRLRRQPGLCRRGLAIGKERDRPAPLQVAD